MMIRQLAHEIKNPLGGIRGAAQLLGRELKESRASTSSPRVIINEADRLAALGRFDVRAGAAAEQGAAQRARSLRARVPPAAR